MLNASVDMLKHLGHMQHAAAIETAIYETLVTDKIQTRGNPCSLFLIKLNSNEFYFKILAAMLHQPIVFKISSSTWEKIAYRGK